MLKLLNCVPFYKMRREPVFVFAFEEALPTIEANKPAMVPLFHLPPCLNTRQTTHAPFFTDRRKPIITLVDYLLI